MSKQNQVSQLVETLRCISVSFHAHSYLFLIILFACLWPFDACQTCLTFTSQATSISSIDRFKASETIPSLTKWPTTTSSHCFVLGFFTKKFSRRLRKNSFPIKTRSWVFAWLIKSKKIKPCNHVIASQNKLKLCMHGPLDTHLFDSQSLAETRRFVQFWPFNRAKIANETFVPMTQTILTKFFMSRCFCFVFRN